MRLPGLIASRLVAALAITCLAVPFIEEPTTVGASGQPVDEAIAEIDDYWTSQYAAGQYPYSAPDVVVGDKPADADCLAGDPVVYCESDGVIYVGESAVAALDYDPSDIRTLTALAYAWGTWLTATWPDDMAGEEEAFAGCAAGVYIGHLWFDFATGEGDVMAAVDTVGSLANTSRAQTDERVLAFMTGFVVGFSGCIDLP